MNQTALIAHVAALSGYPKSAVEDVFRATATTAAAALIRDGEVVLPGLGKLVTTWRDARTARNPATGDPVPVPGHRVVKYRASKALKDDIA